MAKYKKGQSGNPSGRPKGIPNKDTVLRNYLIDLLYRKSDELEKLSARDLLKPISRLLPTKIDMNVDNKQMIVNINKTIPISGSVDVPKVENKPNKDAEDAEITE